MALTYSNLRSASSESVTVLAKSLDEARQIGAKTAFLCHSHKDATLVRGFVNLLRKAGWRVYVDWMDTSLPDRPNRVTAKKIQDRIRAASYFLFLATGNSMSSRWCPWEIGYADGVKNIDTILVVPTRDDHGTYHGNEYLDLYRRIDLTSAGYLAAWRPGEENGTYVQSL